jgi:hypothetical protein
MCITKRSNLIKVVFGEDIKLHEMISMVSQTLVRRIFWWRYSEKNVCIMMKEKWELLLAYSLTFYLLSQG